MTPTFLAASERARAIRDQIATLATNPRTLAFPDPDRRTIRLVCRDPMARQVRRSGAGRPRGAFEQAVRAARDYGADLLRASDVTPATVDEVTRGWVG